MYGDVTTTASGRAGRRSARPGSGRTSASSQGPQGARVAVGGREVLNFCANNYLGLASEPALIRAAQDGLARWGFGLASVRFICGTQTIHKELEAAIARFLGTEDAILYTSCFDANGGLFETLLDEHDVVISDALNHASIIDGIRLCRAGAQRYAHADMADLERILKASAAARTRLIATDGVFSMDGDVAPLAEHLRPGRPVRRARDGGRQPRHRLLRSDRAGHARALRRGRSRGHHHLDARQGARRRQRRLHRGPGARSSRSCASARARTSSRTRCRPPSSRPALACLRRSCRSRPRGATGSRPTPGGSAAP